MKRLIELDGRQVMFEATADTLRVYREEFGEDMLKALADPKRIVETIERLAFVMAHGEGLTNIDEWKKGLNDRMAIFVAAEPILSFWNESMTTTVTPMKEGEAVSRPNTTALLLLRALQLGLSMEDLKLVTVGMVIDMMIERGNDDYDWPKMATQSDFDAFRG